MRLSEIGYKSLIIAGILTLFALPALAMIIADFPTTQINQNQPCIGINYRSFTPSTNGTFEKVILHDLNIKYTDDGVSSGIYLYENNIMIDAKSGANSYSSNGNEKTILFNDNFTAGKTYRVEFNKSGLPGTGCDIGIAAYSGAIAYYDTTPPPPPPPPTTYFATPTSTAAAILANISDQFADNGFLAFAILSAAIILGFWGMEKLLDLMPKDKEK